ncbi:Auxin-induced protein X15 [Hibiscus syriacus]|uniref:Auxin-induced protein X15 n=1 Tax=Hibiscus syriacus TaxID=106335 RepID=A0A6A3BI22_HIBSY|nr:Auxin-induced protein X15 [Hibiscus syriacus]
MADIKTAAAARSSMDSVSSVSGSSIVFQENDKLQVMDCNQALLRGETRETSFRSMLQDHNLNGTLSQCLGILPTAKVSGRSIEKVSDNRLVLQLVSGLTASYRGVGKMILQSNPLPPFYQARLMLTLEESGLAKDVIMASEYATVAASNKDDDSSFVPPPMGQGKGQQQSGQKQNNQRWKNSGGRGHGGGKQNKGGYGGRPVKGGSHDQQRMIAFTSRHHDGENFEARYDHKYYQWHQMDVPKCHIAVYVGKFHKTRFVVPISYLNQPSFLDLLERFEEEFDFDHPMDGLTIPCDERIFIDLTCLLKEGSAAVCWFRVPVVEMRCSSLEVQHCCEACVCIVRSLVDGGVWFAVADVMAETSGFIEACTEEFGPEKGGMGVVLFKALSQWIFFVSRILAASFGACGHHQVSLEKEGLGLEGGSAMHEGVIVVVLGVYKEGVFDVPIFSSSGSTVSKVEKQALVFLVVINILELEVGNTLVARRAFTSIAAMARAVADASWCFIVLFDPT